VVGAVQDASRTPALPGFAAKRIPPRAKPTAKNHRRSSISVISLEEDHLVPEGGHHPSFGSSAIRLAA